jgi:hypothetical protein
LWKDGKIDDHCDKVGVVSEMKSVVLWWGGGWGRGGSSALPLMAEERQTWHIGCVEMDKGEGKLHTRLRFRREPLFR